MGILDALLAGGYKPLHMTLGRSTAPSLPSFETVFITKRIRVINTLLKLTSVLCGKMRLQLVEECCRKVHR